MKLLFLRHGETDANKKHLLIGASHNPSLNQKGQAQARESSQKLPNIDLIYSSPLLRARETANIIGKELGLEVIEDLRIRERDFGKFSGKSWSEIEDGEELKEMDEHLKYDYTHHGGESAESVRTRVEEFVSFLKATHSDAEDILIVAHEGIIRMMYFLYKDQLAPVLPNNSLHEFEV